MTTPVCSSCGQSPLEYAKKLSQIDIDNTTKPKDSRGGTPLAAQQPALDTNRALDISA